MKDKLEKSITIGTTEDGRAAVLITPNTTCADAYQLLGTLALHILNAYYEVAKSSLEQNHASGSTSKSAKLNTNAELNAAISGIKESMYDAMDSVFSNVLLQFYPEAPKNTLEDEAILELTNKKIEERYEQLSDKEKAAFKSTYQNILNSLKEDSNSNDND